MTSEQPERITLSEASASCPHCEYRAFQISSREHAVEVVTTAMNKHLAQSHSDNGSEGGA